MDNDHSQKTTTSMAVIAIVAAVALLGVVIVIAVMTIPVQEAQAGCESGGIRALVHAFNASQGRCFGHGP